MKMKKTSILIAILLAILVISIASAKAPTEPLEKITFIHYKNGKVSVAGAKAPTCYKLLGVKWKTLSISYVISPLLDANAIVEATKEWDSHTSANLFGSYSIGEADFDETPDGKNEYSYGNYPKEGVIAVTNVWYTRKGKEIVEYDVMFDTDFQFADCTTQDCTNKMDLQNIATHETGHGIGLADVYNDICSEVTMYGYSWYGDIGKRTLEQPDINGLQKLYGI
jgi:hypothetical protein